MLKISLVMATAGRKDEVREFVTSLTKQTSKSFELIIVDQNGDDRLDSVVDYARSVGVDITHIKHPVKSLSGARNAGTAIAKYELVAYPDDDCWYDDRVIEGVINRFEYDPKLDGLVARWVEEDPVGEESQQLSLVQSRQFRGILASSITIFVKKSLLRKSGGFDERLGVPGWFGSGEETDLVMRCLAYGAIIRYMPDIVVHHPYEYPRIGMQQICRRIRNRARGTGALYSKNRLSLFVILRGLFGPLIRILRPPYSLRNALANFCMLLGRIEGFLKWGYVSRRAVGKDFRK